MVGGLEHQGTAGLKPQSAERKDLDKEGSCPSSNPGCHPAQRIFPMLLPKPVDCNQLLPSGLPLPRRLGLPVLRGPVFLKKLHPSQRKRRSPNDKCAT
jgi:hypothetical protein